MPFFDRDGLRFHYRDEGHGLPFVFQHGLGGDVSQPFGVYKPAAGRSVDRIRLPRARRDAAAGRCREAHDRRLADDLVALLDHLEIETGGDRRDLAGLGRGRQRGAAVSRASARAGAFAAGVDRSAAAGERPALFDDRRACFGAWGQGRARAVSADAGISGDGTRVAGLRQSLVGQFEQPRAEECVAQAGKADRRYPLPRPGDVRRRSRCRRSSWAIGRIRFIRGISPRRLAGLIPGAELCEITPKSVSLEQHAADVQNAIDGFLGTLVVQWLVVHGPRCA